MYLDDYLRKVIAVTHIKKSSSRDLIKFETYLINDLYGFLRSYADKTLLVEIYIVSKDARFRYFSIRYRDLSLFYLKWNKIYKELKHLGVLE